MTQLPASSFARNFDVVFRREIMNRLSYYFNTFQQLQAPDLCVTIVHMESIKTLIPVSFSGDIDDSSAILDEYSKDTSLFSVRPELAVFPKTKEDVELVVSAVRESKDTHPTLSITGRSAGSDMSGGPLNESIILSCTKYLNHFTLHAEAEELETEPGVFYRDAELEMDKVDLEFASYPASKSLAALGGMVMNNAGGEKTLRYGQTRDSVLSVDMTLSDGKTYTFGKISKDELEKKKSQQDFEGEVYRRVFDLVEKNKAIIKEHAPRTSKNSAGYALWRIWDGTNFDMSQLFVGSQGTLGMLVKAKLKLIKKKKAERLVALFFKNWDSLPEVVNRLLPIGPETLETFDDATMKLGLRFMPEIAKKAGENVVRFALRFLPEAIIGARLLGIPKLIVLVSIAEDDDATADKKAQEVLEAVKGLPVIARKSPSPEDAEKYWVMRRESFNLLRQHVKDKRTAPFIDDFCILPKDMPQFLPKLLAILKEYGIKANIAGHAGDGNYHVIPLMNIADPKERAKIPVVADKVYGLITSFHGSITAEHNDGIMRTPYLEKMFGPEMIELFQQVKNIFDPQNIFNPGKKVGGTIEYMKNHLVSK